MKKVNQQEALHNIQRVLGRYGGQKEGPLVIITGGIHGNEATGVIALKRLLKQLKQLQPPFRGELIALVGNIEALHRKRRYLSEDLNRSWTEQNIQKISHRDYVPQTPEEKEQLELWQELKNILARKETPIIFLDLHTTSAKGPPFALIEENFYSRQLATKLNVPLILGLEEKLEGTLLNYINRRGHVAIGFEGGQHDSYVAIENHLAFLWIVLYSLRCLGRENVDKIRLLRKHLAHSTKNIPQFLGVKYRHEIHPKDYFNMEPGYNNFQQVTKGELLAYSNNKEIRAQKEGYLLFPLYQGQGDDGFFVVKGISKSWMRLANLVRQYNFEIILPWLPGVRRDPYHANTFYVNRKIARWGVTQIFHLLGFRKYFSDDCRFVFRKKLFDHNC